VRSIQGFRGEQIAPGDAGYDEARTIFNAMIDRHPALIARCADTDDVVRAVRHARAEGVELSVRAGGHSVAGWSMVDGGLIVDVAPLKDVHVDPQARIVHAGGGMLWGELDVATQEHGLATTGGRVSTTGVAGFTLGGGSGWIERQCGLACDNLVGAQLVTADGEVIEVSSDEHPELLWALRGGGGNFGVVTRLDLRLHRVGPTVYGGLAVYPPEDGPVLGRAMRDFFLAAPEEVGLGLVYLTAPPEEFIPVEWQGRLVVGIAGCWNGPIDVAEREMSGLLGGCEAIANLFGPIPYTELQKLIDDPPGMRNWWTADYLTDLTDAAVDAFCEYSEGMPAGLSQSIVFPWGGQVARATAEQTPLAQRETAWVVHPFAVWEGAERDAEHIEWGRRSHAAFAPWTTGGTYLNFIGDEGQQRVRSAFGHAYGRLAQIKARYDPENVFRGNQNIVPAPSAVPAG
jgi:FAD/FMN-containing dehydrogenase